MVRSRQGDVEWTGYSQKICAQSSFVGENDFSKFGD